MPPPRGGEISVMKNRILIEQYLDTLADETYRLQLKHLNLQENPEKFDASNEYVNREKLIQRIRYLQWRNTQGFNIYCRPKSLQYVLVDDIKEEMLEKFMAAHPTLILETSPKNFQGYLKLKNIPATTWEASNIACYAAEFFEADAKAARYNQVGRLPGFTNRKPRYQISNGMYP